MTNKTVACIIARTVSSRLPLKVLRDIGNGISIIDFLIERLKRVQHIHEIYICTSNEPVDDILEDVAKKNKVKIYRGSAYEVIERMLAVGNHENANYLVRITGDNPFTATEYIDEQLETMEKYNLDYVRLLNAPLGATAEVIRFEALKKCAGLMDPSESEYMMLFLFEPQRFKCGVLQVMEEDTSAYSVTVDTPADFSRTRTLIEQHTAAGKEATFIHLKEIIGYYRHSTGDLPNGKIVPEGKIKLPGGKEITFAEFDQDMKRRINHSTLLISHAL